MSERPEISHWLLDEGYSANDIEKILRELDRYDEHKNRESLFEDLANGTFDISPIIAAALGRD